MGPSDPSADGLHVSVGRPDASGRHPRAGNTFTRTHRKERDVATPASAAFWRDSHKLLLKPIDVL